MTPAQREAVLRLANHLTLHSSDVARDGVTLLRELVQQETEMDEALATLNRELTSFIEAARGIPGALYPPQQRKPVAWVPRARRPLPGYHKMAAGEFVWEDASTDGPFSVHEPDFELVPLYDHPPIPAVGISRESDAGDPSSHA